MSAEDDGQSRLLAVVLPTVRKGGRMSQRLIEDDHGLFSCEVEVQSFVLQDAMEHEGADEVLKCALIAALTALAEAGPWPAALLDSMASFMLEMREALIQETLS